MSLASAARAAQWQGGSLAKNARGGLKNGRRSGEEGVFLKEASEFARFCSVLLGLGRHRRLTQGVESFQVVGQADEVPFAVDFL